MFGIAWVETRRDGTKIGFLFRFVYPFSYHHWEGGSIHDWGGGARALPDIKLRLCKWHHTWYVSIHRTISHRATVPKNYPKRPKLISRCVTTDMIFAQSSYNYQTRSSNHGHWTSCTARFLHSLRCTEFGCSHTIRTRVHLRDTAAATSTWERPRLGSLTLNLLSMDGIVMLSMTTHETVIRRASCSLVLS